MKRIPILLVLFLCLSMVAFGAQIYGSLRINNASVGGDVLVRIQCAEGTYDGRTDGYGSYNVPLRQSSRCELLVYYSGQWSQSFEVYPYEDPVRYDFDLVPQNGTIVLRRR